MSKIIGKLFKKKSKKSEKKQQDESAGRESETSFNANLDDMITNRQESGSRVATYVRSSNNDGG